MSLLNNPALTNPNTKTNQNENIYTANINANSARKVGSRQIEAVPNKSAMDTAVNTAKSYATTGTVNDNATVQGQLSNILSSGSPLLKRAQVDAAHASAERGLNNSSMAVQAGEEAVIRSALPIAQQDAQTHANQALANQSDVNAFAQQGLNQAYTDYNADKANAFTAGENALDRTQKNELFDKGNAFTATENALDRTQKSELFDKDQAFQTTENALNRDLQKNLQTDQQNFTAEQTLASDERRNAYDTAAAAEKAKTDLQFYDIKLADDKAAQKESIALNLSTAYTDTINKIISDPSITPSQAAAAKRIADENYQLNIQMAKEIFNIDLSAFAPTSSTLSGTAKTDKNGNVTKTFEVSNATPAEVAATNAAEEAKKAAYYNEKIIVTPKGRGARPQTMTRRVAIDKGYIKDNYKP